MNKKVVLLQILRTLMVAGELVFIAVVAILQILQPEYDAIAQPMSELALGIHGTALFSGFVLAAFCCSLVFFSGWSGDLAGIHLDTFAVRGGCFCFMW